MLYVVISTHKLHGSRVMCGATSKENAEDTQRKLEQSELTKHLGPFTVITYAEAERKKLYGD